MGGVENLRIFDRQSDVVLLNFCCLGLLCLLFWPGPYPDGLQCFRFRVDLRCALQALLDQTGNQAGSFSINWMNLSASAMERFMSLTS